MHAIALALTFDEKPNLYVTLAYLDLDEAFLDRIRETGVFNLVKGINPRNCHRKFRIELRKTKGADEKTIDEIGTSLFEKYLEPVFEEQFRDADKDDEIYVYNDFQWNYYYLQKHFRAIVGLEDGYGSFPQYVAIHEYKGDMALLNPFIERGFFPEPLYRSPKITKIICNSAYENDELDDYYREKMVVWDYKDIIELHKEQFRDAVLHVFRLDEIDIAENSSLILGQCLDRAKYCDSITNYLLARKMITNEKKQGHTVYYKPHPAEINDSRIYADADTVVLSQDFPVEVLQYHKGRFAKAVTFTSTAAATIGFADEIHKYFDKADTTFDEIKASIKKETKGLKLNFDFFIKVRKMDPQTYIDALSCIFRYPVIRTNIHLLFEADKFDDFKAYYDISKLDQRISEYKAKAPKRDANALHKELGWIKGWLDKYEVAVDHRKVSSLDDWTVFDEAISRDLSFDYMMLLDSGNRLFMLTKQIYDSMKAQMCSGILFLQHTDVTNKKGKTVKASIKPGYVADSFDGTLVNKIWHRAIIRDAARAEHNASGFAEVLDSYAKQIKKRQGFSFNTNTDALYDLEDGDEYFAEKIRDLLLWYNSKDTAQREVLAGRLANAFYDYYDWQVLAQGDRGIDNICESIESLINDKELSVMVYKKLIRGLFYEKELADRSESFQDSSFIELTKNAVDTAVESGALKRMENSQRILSVFSKRK